MNLKTGKDEVIRTQVRGSSVMLVGRLLALVLNLGVQVLLVRYLSKQDYGSFAFAIAMVAIATNLGLLGLDKALARFMAIYHESQDMRRMSGTIMLIIGTVTGVGTAMVLIVYCFQVGLETHLVSDSLSLSLLLILVFLAPVDGLNAVFQSIFGVFGEIRTVFFRRYILGPLLKLAAVVGVMIFHGSAQSLAICYLGAAIIGLLLYLMIFIQIVKRERLATWFRPSQWQIPAKEIFSFSIPLLSSQLSFLSRTAMAVIFLELFQDSVAVADFRSVIPFSRLNLIVISSFTFLFTPLASRMFTRNEDRAINDLYWVSAIWVMVLTFPALMLTCVFAKPLTLLMFESRYEGSAAILAIMSIGFFFEAALGFTVQTLRVHAKVRCIAVIDVITFLMSITIYLVLIPRFGALGAACGALMTTGGQNLAYFYFMRRATGLGRMEWKHARTYLYALSIAAVLLAIQIFFQPNLVIAILLILIAFTLLLVTQRKILQTNRYFPELARLPLLGRLLLAGTDNPTPMELKQ